MKTLLHTFIIVMITSLLGFTVYKAYKRISEEDSLTSRIISLPTLRFVSSEGVEVNGEQTVGKALWLVFLNTEFDETEAANIRELAMLEDIQIWLVASETWGQVSELAAKEGLDKLSNVQLLSDPNYSSYYTFGVKSFPSSFLYRPDGSLIRYYKGNVKTETVQRDLAGATRVRLQVISL